MADAASLSLADLMKVDASRSPAGFYGRALVFGEQLQAIVGPTGHIGIATTFDDAGQPDFWGWVDSLPESLSREVAAICPPGSRSGH